MGKLQASHPPHIHILPCRQISRPIKSPALWARQASQSRPSLWRAVTVSTRQMRLRPRHTDDRCVAGARHMRRLQLGLKDLLGLHERLVLTFCCRVEMAPIATEGRGGMIARLSASLIKVGPRGDMSIKVAAMYLTAQVSQSKLSWAALEHSLANTVGHTVCPRQKNDLSKIYRFISGVHSISRCLAIIIRLQRNQSGYRPKNTKKAT